jgi:hypothetical protein
MCVPVCLSALCGGRDVRCPYTLSKKLFQIFKGFIVSEEN